MFLDLCLFVSWSRFEAKQAGSDSRGKFGIGKKILDSLGDGLFWEFTGKNTLGGCSGKTVESTDKASCRETSGLRSVAT